MAEVGLPCDTGKIVSLSEHGPRMGNGQSAEQLQLDTFLQ